MAHLQLQSKPTEKGFAKRHLPALKIDMTPMVNLGFLLITFFIFSATMAEQKATDLYIPKDGAPTNISNSNVLTALLADGDNIIIYEGGWKEAAAAKNIRLTNHHLSKGLGSFIRAKQNALGQKKNDLMLLIKPTDQSTYNNLINALDEALICDAKRYAIVAPTPEEMNYVMRHSSGL